MILQRLGLAVGLSALALILTFLLQPVLHLGYSVLFTAAVMVSARFGGLWSGLLATMLASLGLFYFFVPPVNSFAIREVNGIAWVVIFVLVAFLISALNQGRIRAESRLTEANQALESLVAERTVDLMRTNEELGQEISKRKTVAHEKEQIILELQKTLREVTALKGLLPICPHCKKIRDSDSGTWTELESYITGHSEAKFSQTMCPDCAKRLHPKYPFIGG